MEWVQQSLVIGLTEQAPLVLAAMGFALLYRLTGLINVAYAETVTLGAYIGMWVNTTFGLSFYLTLIPTAFLAGLLSVATYFAVFRPAKMRNVSVVGMIIISFGLSIALRYGLQFIFGYVVRYYEVPPPDTIKVLGVGVTSFRLIALGSTIVLALALYWFIQRTSYGVKIRALAGDEQLAQVRGINPLAVTVLIWFVAGVAGGLAGAFYGVGSSVRPWLGFEEFLFILLVVLVGGAGSIRGVLIAGLATGIVLTAITLRLGNALYSEIILILAFMVILKLRGNPLAEAGKV